MSRCPRCGMRVAANAMSQHISEHDGQATSRCAHVYGDGTVCGSADAVQTDVGTMTHLAFYGHAFVPAPQEAESVSGCRVCGASEDDACDESKHFAFVFERGECPYCSTFPPTRCDTDGHYDHCPSNRRAPEATGRKCEKCGAHPVVGALNGVNVCRTCSQPVSNTPIAEARRYTDGDGMPDYPSAEEMGRCSECGHRDHRGGRCFNMESDGDCDCCDTPIASEAPVKIAKPHPPSQANIEVWRKNGVLEE